MRPKKSPVWQYFTECVQDPRHALCKVCKIKVSRGSVNPSKRSTKPLDDHLKKFHVKEYSIVKDLKKESSQNESSSSSIQHGSKENDEVKISKLTSKKARDEAFAATIPGWIKSTEKVGFHSEKGQAFHKSIFEWMMMDAEPFSMVNNLGFQRHHQKFLPTFEIGNVQYFKFTCMETNVILNLQEPKNTTEASWNQTIKK